MPDAAAELLRKIDLGDDSSRAFAEVVLAGSRIEGLGRDALADELAAFANSSGGVLWLGVCDAARAVTGIPVEHLDAVQRYVIEIADDAITPPVVPLIEKLELSDAGGRMRAVLRVEIPRGFFVHRSPGGYLQRVGTSKRLMETAAVARLFEQRSGTGGGQVDLQVVEDATLDDLDPRLVDRFRGKSVGGDRTTALSRLDMVREDAAGVLRPTVAGLLLGTRHPQRWLPHAFIQSVAYRGVSVPDAMRSPRYQLDAKDNDGPLDDQIEYACRFVARNQRVEASKHLGRIDWPQYDLTVVFEAVVNAVAHRDYSRRGSKVRLRMFSDRIELYSPGALANGMRLDEIACKQNARNPAIANLLERCAVPDDIAAPRGTMMDRRGAGVPAILSRSRRLSGRQPVYELFGDELRLTIYAADPGDGDSP
jgi:predicted HTH transcriptional regulator